MKRSFWLPLSIALPIVAIILASQAGHNRKLAEQLAEREASAASPRESRPERARDPGGPGALSVDEMIAKVRSMAVHDDRTGLLRRIAKRDPGRVFEMLPSPGRPVIQGSCLQCHGETPPKQGSCERSVSRIDSMLLEEGWKMADYIFGEDPEMGLRAFADMRERDFSKSNALENYALSGSIPLDDEQVARMAAAIGNPEFAAIRSNIIEITLNDALFEGGVDAMGERLKALPLSGEDLKRYMESVIHDGSGSSSLTKIDILFTEPAETIQWVSEVRNESDRSTMIPDMVLNWANRDADAAFKWVEAQAPSLLRDATLARLVTKGPNLDQASAESWAREIRNQDLRERTLQEVFKTGR